MRFEQSKIDGVLIGRPEVFADARGDFCELYHAADFARVGVGTEFPQDNLSRSAGNVLRGLHFQTRAPQAQVVTIICGAVFDVCVDLRPDSATFGDWLGVDLSVGGNSQVVMAPGIAHGFYVQEGVAVLHYKVSQLYNPDTECRLRWDDPDIAVTWPCSHPALSPADERAHSLAYLREHDLLPHDCTSAGVST